MFCFVDYRITSTELENLKKLGLSPILVPKCPSLYPAIDGHVDIQLSLVNCKKPFLVVQKNIDKDFLRILNEKQIPYILSQSELKENYPYDIPLNALITEDFILHNFKFTDEKLLSSCSHLKKINVKQGYSNCSILKVSRNSFITSDIKSCEELKNNGYDVLLLPPGDIELPGLDYGFIGGVGGLINENTMIFFGSLGHYKYGNEVKKFLHSNKVSYINLKDSPLIDRGGIFLI